MTIDTFLTRDIALLRGFLKDDPGRAGYLLGDLDEPYFESCRWFVAGARSRPVAVLLSFEAFEEPILLSHGAPDGIAAIFRSFGTELAPVCWAKIPLAHRGAFESTFSILDPQPLWTMELGTFRPVPSEDVVQLSVASLPDMLRLYENVVENHFRASQMPLALYFGRYDDGRLVSVAGTHAYSPREHVAVLGNIATASDARNHGHARAVTSRLIQALRERGCATIALQVAADNAPAVATYRQLGFVFRDVVLQARCENTENTKKNGKKHEKHRLHRDT
jgi:GNAT superfamily N-acetyltransferase